MLLRTGDRGPDVEQLQVDLLDAGFTLGAVDGLYGPRTAAAVRDLQRSAGLQQDGMFGPRSAEALAALLDRRSEAADDNQPSPASDVTSSDESTQGDETTTDEVEGHDEDEWLADEGDSQAPAAPASFPDYFDNWAGELAARHRDPFYLHEASGRRLAWKGRPTPVDLGSRTHICMHITAVEFGTSARQRRRWADRIADGDISHDVLERYGVDEARAAERMALHERFWPVAYHWVALRNGDVLYNNPPERYTYHGNRSNRFALGLSIEATLPGREQDRTPEHTTVDDDLVQTGREALRLAVTMGREQGAPLTHITAHRCFSMTRAGDPGEAVWRQIVLPMLTQLDLTVDHDLVDGGRHIPDVWDPSARYDWHDRQLS
jgi:hypothetical protein